MSDVDPRIEYLARAIAEFNGVNPYQILNYQPILTESMLKKDGMVMYRLLNG